MILNRVKYKQEQADHTLFIKHITKGKKAILIIYIDNIIVTVDDLQEIDNLKKQLKAKFELKDLGTIRYFLGMEVA